MENFEILKNIIQSRRSIFPKDYTEKTIPLEVIEKILSTAVNAPNHKKTQPWRFTIFRGEEKQKLGETLQNIYKTQTKPENFLDKKMADIGYKVDKADTIISIVVEFSGLVPEWEEVAATAMAVQNMYLLCTAKNLGCYWASPSWVNHLQDTLNLQENQKCLGLFYIGSLD